MVKIAKEDWRDFFRGALAVIIGNYFINISSSIPFTKSVSNNIIQLIAFAAIIMGIGFLVDLGVKKIAGGKKVEAQIIIYICVIFIIAWRFSQVV